MIPCYLGKLGLYLRANSEADDRHRLRSYITRTSRNEFQWMIRLGRPDLGARLEHAPAVEMMEIERAHGPGDEPRESRTDSAVDIRTRLGAFGLSFVWRLKAHASFDSILDSLTMAQLRERDAKRSLPISARLNGSFVLSARQVHQLLQVKKSTAQEWWRKSQRTGDSEEMRRSKWDVSGMIPCYLGKPGLSLGANSEADDRRRLRSYITRTSRGFGIAKKEIRLALKVKALCKTRDGYIYELEPKRTDMDFKSLVRKQEIGERGPDDGIGKVLMLVGATGAGKSTLINGMVNYAYGVTWNDDFRFKLIGDEGNGKNQAQSQTKWVSAYVLHKQLGMAFPYTLTLVDTPGFGDTKGMKRDDELKNQIEQFFSHGGYFGVDQLDGVALERMELLRKGHASVRQHGGEWLTGWMGAREVGQRPEEERSNASSLSSDENESEYENAASALPPEISLPPHVRTPDDDHLLTVLSEGFKREMGKFQELIKEAHASMHRIDEIALRPNPIEITNYIEMLIRKEFQEEQPGHSQRIKYLEEARRKSEVAKAVLESYDPNDMEWDITMFDTDEPNEGEFKKKPMRKLFKKLTNLFSSKEKT
ncbi:unnamed protein product [Darwinula stevensoni]|uniref:Septin-type G domain-containing protein n=1 Tax=Darwinula stevensoni TaxID=69355 RepID=A0A7R8X1Y8_9CRUS|nr:unnamed protein product [Darwinula stevensoni]CAG0882771.1 unnamed protein product [Darwinula stevensoni]